MQLPAPIQNYLAEPAVDGAPARVWRDWVLVAVMSTTAVLEMAFRTDADWLVVSTGWRWAALVAFFVSVPPALLFRRSHPVLAALYGFTITLGFGITTARIEGEFGGLFSTAIILITLYTVFRWGSGRDGAYGLLFALAAGLIGNLIDPTVTLSDWIGGFIVLSIPILVGLSVRFQSSAQERAVSDAKSLERAEIARELHDTVAHHVSAIAVQAQAGQAMAATDPERALGVLAVIEEAASRTLVDMRSMVGTLRDGAEAELTPLQGLEDLHRLADESVGDVRVTVSVDEAVGTVASASQAAIYRIARESLTNAVRHARAASEIVVAVMDSGNTVTLTVDDDGAVVQQQGSGYGLLGMAERAEILGGTFNAGPRPSGGWRVTATLPRTGSSS